MRVKDRSYLITLGVLQERTRGLLRIRDNLPKGSEERKKIGGLIDSLLVVMEYLVSQVEEDTTTVKYNRKSEYEC